LHTKIQTLIRLDGRRGGRIFGPAPWRDPNHFVLIRSFLIDSAVGDGLATQILQNNFAIHSHCIKMATATQTGGGACEFICRAALAAEYRCCE
jgi:hypothetical protein